RDRNPLHERGGPRVIYQRLGVRPVIHGSGTTTRYGGSRLRPEALEAMREASTTLVNLDELNEAAGNAIAKMLGAEAAFVSAGADLVSCSGGKGIRGPQSTGILAGRRDLIKAVAMNASPNQALGRAAKTSKEEICGLVVALECFLAEDEKAEMKRYHDVCTT